MQTGNVTTPFGRRSMTLGMLASQLHAEEIAPDKAIDKWKIFRWLCEARERIGVSDRALAVLNALLSFHPKNEISEESGLVVFPSNAQLTLRTHGMTGTTLRRNLAQLVDAGLIIRKDSPNGKRYARKTGSGDISEAFGFSLAPLVVRAEEIEAMATEIAAERQHLRRLKERLSLCRRDISKLIETALEEQIPGEWFEMQFHFRALVSGIPRSPDAEMLEELLRDLEAFRDQVVNSLEMKIKTEKTHSNDSQSGRHIQNSNPNSTYESEPRSEKELGATAEPRPDRIAEPPKSFPLAMVLQGCPEIVPYGPGGAISSWRDLMGAAVVVRSMLGVSPSAYQRACEVMGAENAATVIACLLERAGHINSVGGYLRDLTRRAEEGEFSIGPMLMALIRSNGPVARKAG
ncbi:plasmid replication protein RepC [Rhizobium sp. BK251]|uniref:plasmid replication protein RepC n=1 Tax=Rhizobium sp. BK251 TaxID=2512125 RepID=UPI0010500579|nr:plasmid replication protein RepC [Rhizobium sp. BK251]TCL68437.1 replication initiation protein RepC [Rhizobium sp. BK251]